MYPYYAFGLLLAYVTALSSLIFLIFKHLDETDDPKTKEIRIRLGSSLSRAGEVTFEARLQHTSRTFVCLFEKLFGSKGSDIEQGIWLGLLLSPAMLTTAKISGRLGREPIGNLEGILLAGMASSFSVGAGFLVGSALGTRISISRGVGTFSLVVMGLLCGFVILSEAITVFSFFFPVISFFYGVATGSGLGRHSIRLLIPLATLLITGLTISVAIGMHRDNIIGIWNALGLVAGPGTSILAGLALMLTIHRFRIPIHPLKAIFSSIIFVIVIGSVVGSFDIEILRSFFDYAADEPKTMAFVAFNIFGDTLSMLETTWILQRVRSATITGLTFLLTADLILSAAIFLYSPLLVGEVPVFVEGALFRGERPWLGILFWSTFGTSALFYLYVMSVLFVLMPKHTVLKGFLKTMGSFSSVEKKPFTALAYAAIAVLSLIDTALVIWTLFKLVL